MKPLTESFWIFLHDMIRAFSPGIFLITAPAFIENGKYLKCFRHEFVGTLLMIGLTFSPGKWVGRDDFRISWMTHGVGVILADYLGGGPHVNPAVTVAMWSMSKLSYTESYVRIAGQLCGGLIAFPLFHTISNAIDRTPFGGPEFQEEDDAYSDAFMSEFCATLLLMFTIYALNWEINFGKYHYLIKQSLTAVAIRILIELFPTTGPAMNPMLATAWVCYGVEPKFQCPSDFQHYFVYWASAFIAAVLSSVIYTAYAGGSVFGVENPIGSFKKNTTKKDKLK